MPCTITQAERTQMGNRNRLKLGLFGANCSSGRAVTHGAGALVRQLARLPALGAHGRRIRHRVHAADRPLERVRR